MAGVKQSLSVDLAGLRLASPVVAASGCAGTGRELAGLADLRRLGGLVTRTLTFKPSRGWPGPRVAETASGIVTGVGLQNAGVRAFVAEDLPRLARTGTPLIVSVGGASLQGYIRAASILRGEPGIVGLEVYLSGADEENEGLPFYSRIDRMAEVVGAVSRLSTVPVFAKLPALLPDLVPAARGCIRAGAHGLTLIDAVPGMAVDVRRLRPRLGAVIGGLSGPAIRPIALAAVFRVAQALPQVPVMGVGGIATAEDAVEFLLAGAWAVQVGTALIVNPSAPTEIAQGIAQYLSAKGLASPGDLRERLRLTGERPARGASAS
jgi:dihydroorotate dehydrogenase (NAD+) catalytic subunit